MNNADVYDDVGALLAFLDLTELAFAASVQVSAAIHGGSYGEPITAAWSNASVEFRTMEEQVRRGGDANRIQAAGLTGNQLAFKLGRIEDAAMTVVGALPGRTGPG